MRHLPPSARTYETNCARPICGLSFESIAGSRAPSRRGVRVAESRGKVVEAAGSRCCRGDGRDGSLRGEMGGSMTYASRRRAPHDRQAPQPDRTTHRDENMLNEATRHDNKTPSKVPVSSPNLFKAGMGGARDRARCKSETVSSYSRSSPARGSLRLGCRPNAQRGADSIVCAAWR